MITIGLASLPERISSLERTLDSLTFQADSIVCVLNGHKELPSFVNKYKNVYWHLDNNEFGASMKFFMADISNGYYLSTDDDIIYPPTYVRDMVAKVDEYKCIVSLHGKHYGGERPVKSYRRSFTTNVHCLQEWRKDCLVHVGGTGVMAYHTDFFNVSMEDLPYPNMVDVQVAKKASDMNIKIMALAHSSSYLRYQRPQGMTIWNQYEGDDMVQTEILNSFLK